ncbi:MAG: NAD-dependent epimerase/dehydratase family protein [Candidatus Aminicenantes bacterium]|nr:NAD-dependent epimerase/dehydratase family protein [Candidatus Aminicenantes bacterium]
MKNVFVTGASGFTGGHLCSALLKKGCTVTALVRENSKTGLLEKNGIKLVKGDLSNPTSLKGIIKNIDVVFNIAAMYRQEVSKDMFDKVHVEGTKALLEESISAGVKRFVHCSTVGVQGEIENPPAQESAPYNPGDFYQVSKMEGEKLALSYFKDKKIDGVVVRPVGIYGPGDTRFLKLFKTIYKGSFKMIGTGKALYHLTFVEDLVAGIILTGEVPAASAQIYTIGGSEYLPLEDLINLIAEILDSRVSKIHIPLFPVYAAAFLCEILCKPFGIQPPLYRRRLDFFTKDRAFDISKARKELGYSPQVSLREGLTRTAQWYKENGLLD